MTPEQALLREGLELRAPARAAGSWARTVRTGSLVFVAGHGPFLDGKIAQPGKLGAGVTVDMGRRAAELTMLNILGSLKAELGELSRIARFVRVLVFVNATPEFTEHHLVAYGATDLLVKVFGDVGRPALAEVGVASLPFDGAVEIEATVEIHVDV
jgi:enamine deaminase RidA (YjgF/YER057c/UK114 family)